MSTIQHWGSTEAERAQPFPCDDLLPGHDDELFRAVDVAAPPEVVFRWLCQMRVAPYSYDLLDNFGRQSPRTLTPGLEQLEVGQSVMRIFKLVDFEAPRHLTLELVDRAGLKLFGEIVVTYQVNPAPGGSRLIVKMLVRRPRGLMRVMAGLLPAGDLVMMRKQLLTLKALAEGAA